MTSHNWGGGGWGAGMVGGGVGVRMTPVRSDRGQLESIRQFQQRVLTDRGNFFPTLPPTPPPPTPSLPPLRPTGIHSLSSSSKFLC